MKKTKRLITTVTSSLLLSGGVFAPPSFPAPAFVEAGSQTDSGGKNDPEVIKAADKIFGWLKGTHSGDSKTLKEVQSNFPEMNSALLEKALKRLVDYDGRLKKTGKGDGTDPYRYYELSAVSG